MGVISPILGAGQISGSGILRANQNFQDFEDATTEVGIELQFYSNSGELVAIIGSSYEKSNLVNLEIEISKIGDLKKFKFSIGRLIDKPFFNDMEVRFYNNTVHWFTGLLTVKPGQGRRDVQYDFEGKGFVDYIKRVKVEKLYQNKTLTEIVIDLVEDLQDNSKVLYNPGLIDLPDYTVAKLELKNKTIEKGLKEVLEIANTQFQTTQYRYGVNKNREFFFEPISTETITGFFEGFQMQEPDFEVDISELINRVKLYRAQENSQAVELVDTYSDNDSIDKLGLSEKEIEMSDFVDTATAGKIANAMLERYSNELIKATANNILCEDFVYDIGFYFFNTRKSEYIHEINDFENLSEWTESVVNTTLTTVETKTISKNNALKAVTSAGSDGEYIELELDDEYYFPTKLIIYVSVSKAGEWIELYAYDHEGNFERLGLDEYKETETGEEKITESGDYKIVESRSLRIDVEDEYFRFKLPITTLNDIKKIRIVFLTDENITILFDRLDLQTSSWSQYKLVSDKIKYKIEKGSIKANIDFGEESVDLIKDLKKLNKKSENILNIFRKG